MAKIKPFRAIRPVEEFVDKVAELPYDVMSRDEAKQIADKNDYSFLHIDRAEIDLPESIDEYDEKVYLKAKDNLDKFKRNNILIQEDDECIYIYKEVMNNREQIGIVACVSVDDSLSGIIKKHEYTKPDKELDRTNHIRYCKANTGTILVTYKSKKSINKIINSYIKTEMPLYDFISNDKIHHTIWRINQIEIINQIIHEFEDVPYLYIADGHHRAASAENIAKEMRLKYPDYTGKEEFNYYLAMIAPDENLLILDYNRVVKDLNNLDESEFICKIKESFDIKEIKDGSYKPKKKGFFGMYLNGSWYELKFKNFLQVNKDSVKSLDVSILHDYLISPILGIENPREDKRIEFVGGIRGTKELEKRVNEDMKVAFSLYPTDIKELMKVADENKIMPAKSTWFEPKVRCGLFLHELI